MIYGVKLAWRAITSVAMLKGRSRRTEFFSYWLLSLLILLIAGLIGSNLPLREQRALIVVAGLLVNIPVFALFARRLHDQDRSAWWVLILPPLVMMNVYDELRFFLLDPQRGTMMLPQLPRWIGFVGFPLVVASFVFALWPGTRGPNRFGLDPRGEEASAARLPSAGADLSSAP
jgi:uncharacterized membrane protein YhaH (DUF805 family)